MDIQISNCLHDEGTSLSDGALSHMNKTFSQNDEILIDRVMKKFNSNWKRDFRIQDENKILYFDSEYKKHHIMFTKDSSLRRDSYLCSFSAYISDRNINRLTSESSRTGWGTLSRIWSSEAGANHLHKRIDSNYLEKRERFEKLLQDSKDQIDKFDLLLETTKKMIPDNTRIYSNKEYRTLVDVSMHSMNLKSELLYSGKMNLRINNVDEATFFRILAAMIKA